MVGGGLEHPDERELRYGGSLQNSCDASGLHENIDYRPGKVDMQGVCIIKNDKHYIIKNDKHKVFSDKSLVIE